MSWLTRAPLVVGAVVAIVAVAADSKPLGWVAFVLLTVGIVVRAAMDD